MVYTPNFHRHHSFEEVQYWLSYPQVATDTKVNTVPTFEAPFLGLNFESGSGADCTEVLNRPADKNQCKEMRRLAYQNRLTL